MIPAPDLFALTHGWSGLALGYASVQAPMLAGLWRARATAHRLLLSPLIAAPMCALAGVGMALASPLLHGLGIAPSGLLHLAAGGALFAGVGYVGGRSLGHRPPVDTAAVHQR